MKLAILPSVLLAFLAACVQRSAASHSPAYRDVLIEGVPHVKQKPDFCGEACAEMYLRKLGKGLDQDDVFDASALDPMEGRGCYTPDLARALRRLGFKLGTVAEKIRAAAAAKELAALWGNLHADLLRGVPSIVCMHYDDRPRTTEHFRLVLGYDSRSDEVVYHEPAEERGAYRRMKRALFLKLWPLKYERSRWTVIRLRLEAGRLAAQPTERADGFSSADYAQHIRELKKKLPGREFTMVLESPFVVIGDESPSRVKQRSKNTVRWAVDKLKALYFKRDPKHIIDIWLFKDKKSYGRHTEMLFGREPHTPFGFYSDTDRALIMDISTGGGTLVHEIVHPFVEANFPACPAWLNEGLGSLYEQCGEKNDRIHGRTNWRLAGLQQAIRAKRVPPFKTLTGTTTHEFYGEDPGTNYSQARYLCYYLQERGLLEKFYHRFHARQREDPTGYNTLQEVLGEKDMDAFKKKWEAFVLRLRFP